MEVPQVNYVLDDPEAIAPVYATEGSAAMDLPALEDGEVEIGEIAKVDTGLIFEIPKNWEGQIRPRSGAASRGIEAILGTIDSDYRGRVKVILKNNSKATFKYKKGDKLAQMMIGYAPKAVLIQKLKETLEKTERGDGGFGSTDKQTQ